MPGLRYTKVVENLLTGDMLNQEGPGWHVRYVNQPFHWWLHEIAHWELFYPRGRVNDSDLDGLGACWHGKERTCHHMNERVFL